VTSCFVPLGVPSKSPFGVMATQSSVPLMELRMAAFSPAAV
jgi:hypothetical protein